MDIIMLIIKPISKYIEYYKCSLVSGSMMSTKQISKNFLNDNTEKTEDVYKHYKPLYVITKLLCLASYSLPNPKPMFKKIYCFVQFVFVNVMVYLSWLSFTGKIDHDSFGNSTIILYLNYALLTLFLVVTIITFLTSHAHARCIPKILKTITKLDTLLVKRKCETSTKFKFFNKVLLLANAFFAYLLIGEVLLILYIKSEVSIDKIFKGISRILSAATILQYATILNLLYWRLIIVNNFIKTININNEDTAISDLTMCASILQKIYDICEKVNNIFGVFLASVFFLIFIEYLETMFAFLATYWMVGIKIVDTPRIEKLALWEITVNNFLATILHCYVVFFFADLMHKEIKRTNDVLEDLHLQGFSSSKLLKTIYQLYQQINHNKFVFTTAKFTEIGWHQAFGMFGGVISYSVVSTQWYLNVKQKEFEMVKNVTD